MGSLQNMFHLPVHNKVRLIFIRINFTCLSNLCIFHFVLFYILALGRLSIFCVCLVTIVDFLCSTCEGMYAHCYLVSVQNSYVTKCLFHNIVSVELVAFSMKYCNVVELLYHAFPKGITVDYRLHTCNCYVYMSCFQA